MTARPLQTARFSEVFLFIFAYFVVFRSFTFYYFLFLQGGTTWRMRDARTDFDSETTPTSALVYLIFSVSSSTFFLSFCLPLVRWPLAD